MKVCFIGACGHSHQAHRYLKTRADTEICGIAPFGGGERISAEFAQDITLYEDAGEMLDRVKPNLAVVSPVFGLTSSAIIECARRGIDVFAEKPVASTFSQLENTREAVSKSGIRFCAMHYLRYTPAFYHAARMVRNGEIGQVKMLNAQKSYKFGTRPWWYHSRELYGGTIPWVGIHAIDWIYDFTRRDFCSVSALSVGKDPEMASQCLFEMEQGTIASVNLDFYRHAASPSHDDDRIRCVGTEGVLEVCEGKIHVISKSGDRIIIPDSAPELLEEFIEGRECISADEIFYLTKAALCAREASDSQSTVKIER